MKTLFILRILLGLRAAVNKIDVPCQLDIRVSVAGGRRPVDRINFVDGAPKPKYLCSVMNSLFQTIDLAKVITFLALNPNLEEFALKLSRVGYLAGYYLRAKFLGDKRPILSGMKLTHRCTLKCRQCPYWQRPVPDLSWTQILEILPHLYRRGIRVLILEGGEPLLWRDGDKAIHNVVAEAKKYFFCVGVTTNGTLPLDVQTDIIWVSIDGLRDTHDALRGKSFDRIISHIKESTHPKIFANITINRVNQGEITELLSYLKPLVKGITVQFFYPYPESEDLALAWAERAAVLDRLIALKKEGCPLTDSVLALNALKDNKWRCEPWMIANVEPDGTFNQGCYLKNRTPDDNPCELCGFAAHTEISLAYQLHWEAIMAGKSILNIF